VVKIEGSLGLASVSADYLMALTHLFICMPIILLMNTLLGFFFALELSSVLLLLSFAALQNLNKAKGTGKKTVELSAGFNLIFFHFWSSFFSSLLLLYSTLNLFFLFGTTEWAYLNLFLQQQLNHAQPKLLLVLTLTLLIVGLLIKLGVGPFFAYKLELYQGLPLYALVFYSILYFGLFMAVTIFIFGYYLPSYTTILSPLLIPGFILTFLFFSFFLFDSLLLRQFFALSSLITAINLFTLLL
jgi:NADH:ubiquinone oxidoreductase subunit 2 (subunit N)